ncbi:MAG: L-ribulose-5-phosphate 4-epimerase AraD [Puniceicoccales bacterium]|jgi:L-ribulose-5-phosphate 4-epimerase|nr:L-ribulose-5-phosphate 4-epimerase AraD [Puniceicoccales bacterium]
MDYKDIREECLEANLALPRTGLVDLTFGNVSVADPARRVFAIKPSGVDYTKLTAADIVVLDYQGNTLAGGLRPSSDTPSHRRLYLGFAGVRSVVHTHSRNAVAFAQAAIAIPCLGTTHCDYFHGPVPVTRALSPGEVETAYEWETGNVIVECFERAAINPLEVPAVLVRNHGPFAWGTSGAKAVETALALEIIADMALKTISLDRNALPAPAHILKKHYLRKHGPGAYYGQKS